MRFLAYALLLTVVSLAAAQPVKIDKVLERPALAVVLAPPGKTAAVAFVHGGQWLLAVDSVQRVRVLDLSGKVLRRLPVKAQDLQAVGEGDEVILRTPGSVYQLWNVRSGTAIINVPNHSAAFGVSPGGQWLVTSEGWTQGEGFYGGTGQCHVRLLNMQSFRHPRTIYRGDGPLSFEPVAVAADGQAVASIRCSSGMGGIGPEDQLVVWSGGKEARNEGVMFPVTVQFSPDGQRIALAESPHPDALCASAVSLWSFHSGKLTNIASLQLEKKVVQAFFTPDGHWVVGHSSEGDVFLFDGHTGQPSGILAGRYADVAAGPHGLALVQADGSIVLWPLVAKAASKAANPTARLARP